MKMASPDLPNVSSPQDGRNGSRHHEPRVMRERLCPSPPLNRELTVLLPHLNELLVAADSLTIWFRSRRSSRRRLFIAWGPDELSSIHQRQPDHDVPGRPWRAGGGR